MQRTMRSPATRLATLAAGGLLLAAGGCEDNRITFFIERMAVPVAAGPECTFPVTQTASSFLAEGTMDVGLRSNYRATPVFHNELVSRRNAMELRPESNHVNVEGFVIELHENSPDGPFLEPAPGQPRIVPFTVYQTTYVPPGMGGSYGIAGTEIEVIPAAVGAQLFNRVCAAGRDVSMTPNCPNRRYGSRSVRVIARLQPFGRSGGGVPIEAPFFDFPITVCCGCLVRFPPEANRADTEMGHRGPDCLEGVALLGAATCRIGQDYEVDCRVCATSRPEICQPPGYAIDPRRNPDNTLPMVTVPPTDPIACPR